MTILDSTALPEVTVTHHDGGVTVDFRLPDDPRLAGRQRAWRAFEVGIFLLIGSIFWFAVCIILEWQGAIAMCVPAFLIGIGLLIAAANMSSRVWRDASIDDAVRQLTVADNMLIRTSPDHRMQIWYRHEIRGLTVEADGAPTVHILTLHLQTGDKVGLMWSPDARPVESIADVLRQALAGAIRPDAPPTDAIQADRTGIKH